MDGIVAFDYADRYRVAAAETREDIVDRIEKFPEALQMLFDRRNFGKLVLKVADG